MSKISLGPEDKKSVKNFKTPIIAGVSTLLVLCLVFVMVKVNSSINKDDTKALNNSSAVEAMAGVNSGSGKDKNNGKEDNKSVNSGSSKDNKDDDKNGNKDNKSDDSGSDIKNTKQQDLIKAQEIINRSKKSEENPISDENEILDNIDDYFVDDSEAYSKIMDDLYESSPNAVNNFSNYISAVQDFYSFKDSDWLTEASYDYYTYIKSDINKATETANMSYAAILNDGSVLDGLDGVIYSSYYIIQSARFPDNFNGINITEDLESKSLEDLQFLNLEDDKLYNYMISIPGFDSLVYLGQKYDLSSISEMDVLFSSKIYVSYDVWNHEFFNDWKTCSYIIPFKDINSGNIGIIGYDDEDNFISLYII